MIEVPLPWPHRGISVVRFDDHEAVDALLSPAELEDSAAFRLAKRREEWRLSRAAGKLLAMRVGVCDDPRRITLPRPVFAVDGQPTPWFVSLSHSRPYAGAICGQEPVGIDVQVVRTFSESAAHLFLSREEEEQMKRCTIADRILHFWCAKEAAWKQRSTEFVTMKQLPLSLEREEDGGLLFEAVETIRIEDLVSAVTR